MTGEQAPITLEVVRAMDARDPLAAFRARFLLPDGVIYLDGNSLGPLPRGVPERLAQVARAEWGEGLIRSWTAAHWIEAPGRVGDAIARLVGARAGEVVAADSTSVNLHKLLLAALALRPDREVVLSDTGNFPNDLYIAEGAVALSPGRRLDLAEPEVVERALDARVAVLVLSQVDYRTGRRHDMEVLTRRAHEAGALVIWDLCHSAGAFPVDLEGCGADLAVGCGYKYLNGGPGAPAWLYVAERLQAQVRPVLSGWMGHEKPFDFDLGYRPATGIARNLAGTPAILGLAALETALEVFDGVDMDAVRAKSLALGDLLVALVRQRLGDEVFTLATPVQPEARGSQIGLRHPHAYAVVQALIAEGVIGDFRAPDIARFGMTSLYLRFEDIWRAAEILERVMTDELWRAPQYALRSAVT